MTNSLPHFIAHPHYGVAELSTEQRTRLYGPIWDCTTAAHIPPRKDNPPTPAVPAQVSP